jgi:hypothetical protein
VGVGHGERGYKKGEIYIEKGLWEKGITMTREKMGIQWNRYEISGSGPQEKKAKKSRYHYDHD